MWAHSPCARSAPLNGLGWAVFFGIPCPCPRSGITLAGIGCIIMREVYATMGESIYLNPSFLSRDFPEASGRLLRNHKEFTFQDMAN